MNEASGSAPWLRRRAHEEATRAGAPAEIAVSYPVPVRDPAGLVAAFYATIAAATPDRTNFEVFPPTIRVWLRWATGDVVSVEVLPDIQPTELQRPVGLARPAEFAGPRYEEQEERLLELETTLLDLLVPVAMIYGANQDDPPRRRQALECFGRLVPAPIRALYVDLNPDFFSWLESGPREEAAGSTASTPRPEGLGPWAPTHSVPPGGMPARPSPDPSAPVIANLDPGLPLQVVAAVGDWAQVMVWNGWTGWVDARLLVPRT